MFLIAVGVIDEGYLKLFSHINVTGRKMKKIQKIRYCSFIAKSYWTWFSTNTRLQNDVIHENDYV